MSLRPDLTHFRAFRGHLPATRQDPGGLGVASQKGPREQSAHELLASSPLDSHTLGTHSSKDPWPGGDRAKAPRAGGRLLSHTGEDRGRL